VNFEMIARTLDREESKPVEAAWAYEVAIRAPDASLDLFLNLVAIYYSANDFGYAAARDLDRTFADAAYYRAIEILDEATVRFRGHPEVATWRLLLEERVVGAEPEPGSYENLASHPQALLAPLLALEPPATTARLAEISRSLADPSLRETERGRYLASLLGSRRR